MAAAPGRSDRVYHQDYIARIRYDNRLPPPPNPPKLLDIPNTGLATGQYTSPAFVSRLLREQPLNIEADAELGMPIDLIGLPGVFEGDESAIYALDNPPPPHPNDKPLLRSIAQLGKGVSHAGVSFLRRTEYIASDPSTVLSNKGNRNNRFGADFRKRKREDAELDNSNPLKILRAIHKGFDLAYPKDAKRDSENGVVSERPAPTVTQAWEKPRHPTRPELTVLDTYPILPDLDAFPDTGFYWLTRFSTNPSANIDEYDPRLDVGLLRPLDPSPEVLAQMQAEQAAYDADPVNNPEPQPPRYNYEFFIPENPNAADSIKTKFNVNSSKKDDASLYDAENKESGKKYFRYSRLRAYETYQQSGDTHDYYGDTVALALHDGDEVSTQGPSRLQKGAYFYPIYQRTTVRPRRQGGMSAMGPAMSQQQNEDAKIDYLEVVVREPDEAEVEQRRGHREFALTGARPEVVVE